MLLWVCNLLLLMAIIIVIWYVFFGKDCSPESIRRKLRTIANHDDRCVDAFLAHASAEYHKEIANTFRISLPVLVGMRIFAKYAFSQREGDTVHARQDQRREWQPVNSAPSPPMHRSATHSSVILHNSICMYN